MGGVNVKNTMIEWLLHKVAPHPCSGCGKIDTILCEDCKNDIAFETFDGCIYCGSPENAGVCAVHHSPLERAFIVGSRQGTLETLINKLKFQNVKAAVAPLAELLAERLPSLPPNTVLVPVPTAAPHIRQRGYDQVGLLARQLGYLRKIPIAPLLQRAANTTQHTETKTTRKQQAATAFKLREGTLLDPKATYLLIDDVITTGSTLDACARLLCNAGGTVWAAGLAYQPLED